MDTIESNDAIDKKKKVYECKTCKKVFNHCGNCRRHEKKCCPKTKFEEKEFVCTKTWCKKDFSRKANRDRHSELFCKRMVSDKV